MSSVVGVSGGRRAVAMTTGARASADDGLIGLAVMGQYLALNTADHGYRVPVCYRPTAVSGTPTKPWAP